MSNRLKKILSYVLKLGVSILAIIYIIRTTGSTEIRAVLSEVKVFYFIAGIALYILSQLVSTQRLNVFLHAIEVPISFKENLRLYFIGMAYNLFLPGGIGGDAYKLVYYKNKYQSAGKTTFQALLLDRLFGLLAIALILALVGILMISPWPKHWFAIAFPLVLIAAFFGVKVVFRHFVPVFWPALGYSLVIQLIQVCAAICLGMALGFHQSLAVAFTFLLSSIATAIPVFLGGIGARELVFGEMALLLDHPESIMVGTAILLSLVTLISAIPGLFLDWKSSKA